MQELEDALEHQNDYNADILKSVAMFLFKFTIKTLDR